MRHVPVSVLAGLLASIVLVSPALSDFNYMTELTAAGVQPPSSSSATGFWSGAFADHGEHPDECPGHDGRLRIDMRAQTLECEPDSVAYWIREDGQEPVLYERLPFEAEILEVGLESCGYLREFLWVVVETDCYPEGEIGGHVREEISLPITRSSWASVKATYR